MSIRLEGLSENETPNKESSSTGLTSIFTAAELKGFSLDANNFITTLELLSIPSNVASAEPALDILSVALLFVAFFSPFI